VVKPVILVPSSFRSSFQISPPAKA